MGFYRLIYRIGRMIFRDFLFKIPKKYLVVIIIFLVFMLLKSSVFGYAMTDSPIANKTDTYIKIPYENIVAWYEYYPLYDGNGNNYNGNTYKLDTNYRLFTDDVDSISISGKIHIPYYANNGGANNAIVGFRSTSESWYYDWGWNLYENSGQWLKSSYFIKQQSKNVNTPVVTAQNKTFPFSMTFFSSGNIGGTINNTSESLTVDNTTEHYDTYIHDKGYLGLNCGSNTNGTIQISNIEMYSTSGVTHSLYPCQAMINDAYMYGLYDIYGGDFYRLDATLQLSQFGSQLTGNNIPPNMNNFDDPPIITNLDSEIESWTFDTLDIDGGSIQNIVDDVQNDFYLIQYYDGKRIKLNINEYKTVTMNHVSFSVPRSVLLSNSAIISGYNVDFRLSVIPQLFGAETEYVMSDYTLNITQTAQDNINEDRTQQNLDNIYNAQQQTTNAINGMNSSINNMTNTITNDNVSSSVIQQPSVPTDSSGVENGVNNIFTVIMNGFTNFDSTQNVVLPIPFTDKSIIISGSYTRDMLTSVNASWVINFITIFWWYIISVYIVKDVLKMVDKIQEGKIDNIESSNIKGDML